MISAIVREARPKQWIKNVLVFAAPAALGDLSASLLWKVLLVFCAFSMTASGTYFWNDIKDVEADRRHPKKRHRPIAAGDVPLPVARVAGTFLLVGGPAVALLVRPQAGAVVGLYAILTILYSTHLKHVPILDLAVVASGFVLRAMAGAVGTETHMSTWFVLCTTFGSLFIVTGKRFAELLEMGEEATSTRRSLAAYSLPYLRQVLGIACTATIVSYCLWAFENNSAAETGIPWHGLSIVPLVLALLRYLMVLEQGGGGAPEEVFTRDRAIQLYGLVWVVVYCMGVYAS